MIARTPTNCPTREWSNVSELEDWLREAENTPPARPPETAKDGQKLAFDTYLLAPRKSGNSALCLCGIESHFLENVIRLGKLTIEVPFQWSDGHFTATQIVEGKIARKIMRSQKTVLCQVEDDRRKWFEVAVLGDDLDYPFGSHYLNAKCLPFNTYAEAATYFKAAVNKAKKGGSPWSK